MDSGGRVGGEIEQMRAGVRARILEHARQAGAKAVSPTTLVALLSSSALAPVVAVGASAGPVSLAAIGMAGSLGTGALARVINDGIDRWRTARGEGEDPDTADVEAALATVIEEGLVTGGETAEALRQDLAKVFSRIGAAEVAVQAAVEAGNAQVREHITDVFSMMADDFAGFRLLTTEALEAVIFIKDRLQEDDSSRRSGIDLSRQALTQLGLLREELRAVLRELGDGGSGHGDGISGQWADRCPYRGLLPFGEEHGDVFFGRERITTKLMGRLNERLSGPSVVVVTGPSGAGKSSLLGAGLVPELARGKLGIPGSDRWPRFAMTPTTSPLDELAGHLAVLGDGLPTRVIRRELLEHPDQAHLLIRDIVGDHQRKSTSAVGCEEAAFADAEADAEEERLILVVDQFERIFALDHGDDDDRTERDAFITALITAATVGVGPAGQPAALVVLGVRGDYWDRCAAQPQLTDVLQHGQFVVGAMSEPELRQAITGPAATAGLVIDPGLTNHILSELRSAGADGDFEPAALPFLSQAMLTTWNNRDGNQLTLRGYQTGGGVADAVEVSAEAAYGTLTADQKDLTRTIFRRLTVVSPRGTFGRRQLSRSDLISSLSPDEAAETEAVLAAFTDRRLLVSGDKTIEISHDALLVAWPRLRNWIESDRDILARYSHLLDRARTWIEENRDPSYLYRGTELAAARQNMQAWEHAPDRLPVFDESAKEFLAASSRVDAARRRGARLAVTTLATLTVLMLIAAVVATQQSSNAREARERAEDNASTADENATRALAQQARALTANQPALAVAVAAEALERSEIPEHLDALQAAHLAYLRTPGRLQQTMHVTSADEAFPPAITSAVTNDASVVATAGYLDPVRLWSSDTGDEVHTLDHGNELVVGLAFNHDGSMLATQTEQGEVRLWSSDTGDEIHTLDRSNVGPALVTVGLAFNHDGTMLATAGANGIIRLWDTGTGEEIRTLTGHDPHAMVNDVAFNQDSSLLATTSTDGTARLWNPHTGEEIRTIDHDIPIDGGVAFNHNGTMVATLSMTGTVRLWNPHTGEEIHTLDGHDGVTRFAFNGDGSLLATGSHDNTVRLWDPTTGNELRTLTDDGPGMAASNDGSQLTTLSSEGTVRVWDFNFGDEIRTLSGHNNEIWHAAFSDDGSLFATSSEDGTIRLWDLDSGDEIQRINDYDVLQELAFNSDLTVVAIADVSRVEVLDLRTGETIHILGPDPWGLSATTFNHDGTQLATISTDGTIRLWNPHTGDETRTLRQRSGGNGVAFNHDSSLLATSDEGGIVRLWAMDTGEEIRTLTGPDPQAAVNDVAFNHDSSILATASADGTARLWNPHTGEEILAIELDGQVHDIELNHDGSILATATALDPIRFWSTRTAEEIHLPSDDHAGYGSAFNHDSSILAWPQIDGTIRLWPLVLTAEDACALINTQVSREELVSALGGADPQACTDLR